MASITTAQVYTLRMSSYSSNVSIALPPTEQHLNNMLPFQPSAGANWAAESQRQTMAEEQALAIFPPDERTFPLSIDIGPNMHAGILMNLPSFGYSGDSNMLNTDMTSIFNNDSSSQGYLIDGSHSQGYFTNGNLSGGSNLHGFFPNSQHSQVIAHAASNPFILSEYAQESTQLVVASPYLQYSNRRDTYQPLHLEQPAIDPISTGLLLHDGHIRAVGQLDTPVTRPQFMSLPILSHARTAVAKTSGKRAGTSTFSNQKTSTRHGVAKRSAKAHDGLDNIHFFENPLAEREYNKTKKRSRNVLEKAAWACFACWIPRKR